MKHKRRTKFLTFKQLRNFIGSSATAHRFADKYDLVYFGSVSQDDESRLVKGITISGTYRDSHYLVGTAYNRDLIFLQRSDTVYSSTHKKREHYTWNILVIDLAPNAHLPHMYVEGRSRHGHGFYETLAMTHREFTDLPLWFTSDFDKTFSDRFVVHLAGSSFADFPTLITPERAAVLAYHFHMLDFEWHDDVLYVYFLSSRPTLGQLEHMMKAGVWLAGELDKRS